MFFAVRDARGAQVEGAVLFSGVNSDNTSDGEWQVTVERVKDDRRWDDGAAQQRLHRDADALVPRLKQALARTIDDLKDKSKGKLYN